MVISHAWGAPRAPRGSSCAAAQCPPPCLSGADVWCLVFPPEARTYVEKSVPNPQNAPQMSPQTPKLGPQSVIMGPKWGQNGQDGPSMAQTGLRDRFWDQRGVFRTKNSSKKDPKRSPNDTFGHFWDPFLANLVTKTYIHGPDF